MHSLFNELRVLFADLLAHQALRVMPSDEPEAKLLKQALDGYVRDSAQHARWVKTPA